MEKQELRNFLAEIEDDARRLRNMRLKYKSSDDDIYILYNMIAQLTQQIRQEIVK